MQIYDIAINKNRKEITQHGTYGFPLAIYTTQTSKNVLGYIPWHWHSELQFCYAVDSTVLFYINQKGVLLHSGEGVFINRGILHMAKPFQISDATFICIDFNPNLISGFPGSDIEKKYVTPYTDASALAYYTLLAEIPWQKEILEKLTQIYNIYNQKDYGFEIDICIALMQIWRNMMMQNQLKQSDCTSLSAANNLRLQKILSYIHDHYPEKITLAHLSNEIHVSPNECCRFFKKYMNYTLFEYLLDYRLIKSTELLHGGAESISQIAYSCGFASTSYYIDKFRKKIGCTPLEFRKRQKK